MKRRQGLIAINLILLIMCITVPPASSQVADDRVRQDLIVFMQLLNLPIEPIKHEYSERTLPIPQTVPQNSKITWSSLMAVTRNLELPFEQRKLTLEEIGQRGGIALLHLSDPDDFVLVKAVGSSYTLIFDGKDDAVITNQVLAHHFLGEALLLVRPPANRPWTIIDNPVRVVHTMAHASQEITERVVLTNQSDQVLKLSVEQISCGCTGAELSTKSIVPGQNAILTLKMRMEDQIQLVTVNLLTNDPYFRRTVIALQAIVPDSSVSQPPPIIMNGQIGKITTQITQFSLPSETAAVEIVAHCPFLTAKLTNENHKLQSKTYDIMTSIAANAPPGPFTDQLIVTLKNASVSHLSIPVQGFINSDIVLNPTALILNKVKSGAILKRTVVVESLLNKQFALKAVRSNNPHITTKAVLDTIATRHEIQIEIKVIGETGTVLQYRVKLTLSDGRELDLDILGMVGPIATSAVTTAAIGNTPHD